MKSGRQETTTLSTQALLLKQENISVVALLLRLKEQDLASISFFSRKDSVAGLEKTSLSAVQLVQSLF